MATQLSATVFGTIEGSPPYGDGLSSPTRRLIWKNSAAMSFPTGEVVLHPVNPQIRIGSSSNYIYSVIEVIPGGMNQHSQKYASSSTVASLITAANT